MVSKKPPPEPAYFQATDAPAYEGPERRNRDQIYQMLKDQSGKLDTLIGAFPDGDTSGHRRYHELVIKREERKERLHQAIIEKSVASLAWALLVTLAYSVWGYIKDHLK